MKKVLKVIGIVAGVIGVIGLVSYIMDKRRDDDFCDEIDAWNDNLDDAETE